jgi:hypothetical protein
VQLGFCYHNNRHSCASKWRDACRGKILFSDWYPTAAWSSQLTSRPCSAEWNNCQFTRIKKFLTPRSLKVYRKERSFSLRWESREWMTDSMHWTLSGDLPPFWFKMLAHWGRHLCLFCPLMYQCHKALDVLQMNKNLLWRRSIFSHLNLPINKYFLSIWEMLGVLQLHCVCFKSVYCPVREVKSQYTLMFAII